jgi:PAS domain S-box-containing protein
MCKDRLAYRFDALGERGLSEIIQSTMDAIIILDEEQRIRVFNRAAEQTFGCTAVHAMGQSIDRFIPERFRPAHRRHIQRFGNSGATNRSMQSPGTLCALRANGEEFPIEATISHVTVKGRQAFTVILRDLTERARAEAERQRLADVLEQEQRVIAALTQRCLGEPPRMPGLEIACVYQPALTAERVGGDYYDFFRLEHGLLAVVVGDVCGKGLPAALHAITTRNMLRAYAREDSDPAAILSRLNRALQHEMDDYSIFVTLVYLIIDLEAGCLVYAVAGHPPPVLFDPERRRCSRLEVTGGIVGGIPEIRFRTEVTCFPPGAVLAIFTDGVTEAGGPGDPLLADGGVSEILVESAHLDTEAIANTILARATERARGSLPDDVAIVVIRRVPGTQAHQEEGAGVLGQPGPDVRSEGLSDHVE